MKSKTKFIQDNESPRQVEAAKTSRLRALRLAKEAADKEAAANEKAAQPTKSTRLRASATKKPASALKPERV